MANALVVGSLVINDGKKAKVIGFWHWKAGMSGFVYEMSGWPILKAVGANGKAYGDKWVADPEQCELV